MGDTFRPKILLLTVNGFTMKTAFLFILFSLFSCSSLAQWQIGLDFGASNYSFLDLQSGHSDVKPIDLPFGDEKFNESGPLEAAIGIFSQYELSDAWQAEASLWYLGKAEVEGRTTYFFEDGSSGYTGGLSTDFYALALQIGYRSSLAGFPCVWNAGGSRFLERTTGERIIVGMSGNAVQPGSIIAFDVEESSRERTVNHVSLGLILELGAWGDNLYQVRLQHIQSFYGPLQTLTLGLSF